MKESGGKAAKEKEVHFYVRLSFEGMHLFVPHEEVYSIETVGDIQLTPESEEELISEGVLGVLTVGEYHFPVYALDNRMRRLSALPPWARYCLVLMAEELAYGLVCTEVESLHKGYDLSIQKIPACLKTEQSPFEYLAVYNEDQLGEITDADKILRYLQAWEENTQPLKTAATTF